MSQAPNYTASVHQTGKAHPQLEGPDCFETHIQYAIRQPLSADAHVVLAQPYPTGGFGPGKIDDLAPAVVRIIGMMKAAGIDGIMLGQTPIEGAADASIKDLLGLGEHSH